MNLEAGDFVLPVDKPAGPTSHDVVAMARRAIGTRRVGHTGTLDPFASGLLLLCFGRATRLAEYLTGLDKSYLATAKLGIETDTLDLEGEVVSEHDGWDALQPSSVEEALASFAGDIEQVPPQFSAKKVDGEAMHRKARRGEHVELEAQPITIHEIELMELAPPLVRFRVRCSSGTYVRALARDLGRRLGVGAHLTALRRTAVGDFDVESAIPLDALDDPARVETVRIPPTRAVEHLGRMEVDGDVVRRLRHGQRVRVPATVGSGAAGDARGSSHARVAVHRGDELVAIARFEDGVIKPTKVFPE